MSPDLTSAAAASAAITVHQSREREKRFASFATETSGVVPT
jgi:hypothetical protein